MATTIKVNGSCNTLVHKGSNGVSTATIPDVCKTPSSGGPVPIPYPNVSQSNSLANGTTTVKADGGNMIANKGSEFSRSNGDEAGTIGGVKSSTFIKKSTWILYSFDVKIEGKNACRLTDKKFHNHQNTANLGGEIQEALGLSTDAFKEVCQKCKEFAENQAEGANQMQQEYENERGRHATGPQVRDAIIARVGGHIGGTSSPDGRTQINDPPPGTPAACEGLWRYATDEHEQTHQNQDNDLQTDHGANWLDVRNDPDNWIDSEIEAHQVEEKVYTDFLQECLDAGA